MAKKYAVRVMFPGLTHGGKIYGPGEVEENPDNFLLDLAKSGEKRYHSDSKREIRMAKLIRAELLQEDNYDENDFMDDANKEIIRTPVYVDNSEPEDGLRQKSRAQLVILAANLGFKKDSAKKLFPDKLVPLIRFLRTL